MSNDLAEVKRRVRALSLRLFEPDLSEGERKLIHRELDRIVPDPEYSEYIFYPTENGLEDGPTVSDVIDRAVEKAFQYKPIVL